jgi:hypothetical protein
MKIPFLAVSATTSKIMSLLTETGLAGRMIHIEELDEATWTRSAGFSQERNKPLRICSITSRRSLTPPGDCF